MGVDRARSISPFNGLTGALLLAVLLASSFGTTVSASEYGVSSYRPGQVDLFAGYLAPPGTALLKTYFLYQDASVTAFTGHGQVEVSSHIVTYTSAVFAAYVTKVRILGGDWGFGAIEQSRIATQSFRIGPAGRLPAAQTDTIGGFGDLLLAPVMLSWQLRQFHLLAALLLYAPTGSYDRDRIVDIGLNRWASEADAGLTWVKKDGGGQASVFAGYTINRENTATHYRSGDEFHADFVLAEHLPLGFVIGMAGYALQQTTADSGSGAIFGPFKGRVVAIGPLAGKAFELWQLPVSLSFKYEFEFATQNHLAGNALWLTASTRF